jgi:hypothetical protein
VSPLRALSTIHVGKNLERSIDDLESWKDIVPTKIARRHELVGAILPAVEKRPLETRQRPLFELLGTGS